MLRKCIRQMAQHRHNFPHNTAIRFDVGVPRSPARCLVSSAQHNVAINVRTARRDSDTESRPLMAPDFNLCVDLGTPTLTILSVTSRSDSPWPLTHTDVNANCTYDIHPSRYLLKLKWPRIWVTSWPRRREGGEGGNIIL